MSDRPFFPAGTRVRLGVLLLLGTVVLTVARHRAITGPLETWAYFEANRTPGDSVGYASSLYHGSHARAAMDRRWSASGYALHGTLGGVLAVGLIVSGLRRRAG